MLKRILTIFFAVLTTASYSQSKKIVGSWISRDSIQIIHFFANEDGTILERHGFPNDNIWEKAQRNGRYVFVKDELTITWSDKTIEHRTVQFEDHFNAAKIKFTNKKGGPKIVHLFLRLMDEEVISN